MVLVEGLSATAWVELRAKQLIGSLRFFWGGGVLPPKSDSELDARVALKSPLICPDTQTNQKVGFSISLQLKSLVKQATEFNPCPCSVYYDAWRHINDLYPSFVLKVRFREMAGGCACEGLDVLTLILSLIYSILLILSTTTTTCIGSMLVSMFNFLQFNILPIIE